MLFFKPDIPEAVFQNNQTELAKQGFVVSTQEMALNGQKDMREQVTSFLPFILCIFSISLVGIISFNILSTLQQSRLFSILYICGARWRNCLSVCVGYVLCVCGFSLLLGGAFYSFARANGLIEETGIVFSAYNVWWSLALYGIVLAATLLPPYILLKRQSPVEILRTEE